MWYHKILEYILERKRGWHGENGCWGGLLLVVCLLGLGGCVFGSVDEMYALPKSSEAYVNLQAKINEEKGTGEYIAPLNGENRQTIQLVDVDEDGIQEAVAFFRDADADTPLRIVIFKQDDQGGVPGLCPDPRGGQRDRLHRVR